MGARIVADARPSPVNAWEPKTTARVREELTRADASFFGLYGRVGRYSAVTEAEADVFAVAESPAEALERGHSMRCLMIRRLSA